MSNLAIKADNVTKQYRLGAIGGGTLKGDLQSFMARVRHKEDPNSKIGSETVYGKNQKFLALDGVSFEVEKGDILGIIGHNGAGKSTLLKLLSRVTAPTSGTISLNGRIASMLEVGTGFHPELTGRENVYMNGAILGMTKAEIDRKFDEIVEFAEMGKFIDTPVKRYSSGMYVKLAFAVAAHLDSEILVMDEVLAVGDMKFQDKCLGKMSDVSSQDGRTVLYVSHNMSTIKRLCKRCMVLDHGKKIFDGGVNEAIDIYSHHDGVTKEAFKSFENLSHKDYYLRQVQMLSNEIVNTDDCIFETGDKIHCILKCHSDIDTDDIRLRVEVWNARETLAGLFLSKPLKRFKKGEDTSIEFELDTSYIGNGSYEALFILYRSNELGVSDTIDMARGAMAFDIRSPLTADNIEWLPSYGGYTRYPDITLR
ncbi:MAG: ABC transporter ATP-binding protein [Acutalibacteraceae bacterium]